MCRRGFAPAFGPSPNAWRFGAHRQLGIHSHGPGRADVNQDPGLTLPCVCAVNAPREVSCPAENLQLDQSLVRAEKRQRKAVLAFDTRPTRASALRARDANLAWLDAIETTLTRCRACLEFHDEAERFEEMFAVYLEVIESLDQLLEEQDTTHGSQQIPQQQLRNQGQQRQRNIAKAQRAYSTTRRVMRWFNLR